MHVLSERASCETAMTESSIDWTAETLGNSRPARFVLCTLVCNA